jgi:hypothetical protein
MAIKIKTNSLEVYCEKFNVNNGVLNINEFVGIEKQNIGHGLHILLDSTVEINNINESFTDIKEEAWNNIKNNYEPLKIKLNEDLYKDEGLAIFIKGKMVIGIHPKNLENNLMHLAKGNMGFDWGIIAKNNGVKIEE